MIPESRLSAIDALDFAIGMSFDEKRELVAAHRERDALRAFAQAIMECGRDGDIDGGDLQRIATEHGLLIETQQAEPCGENCACLEFVTRDEWPVTCYRRTPMLTGERIEREARR